MKLRPIKIMTVVGTRPEIIRLSRIISRLNTSDIIQNILVHTGQNYDFNLNQIFFDELNIPKPNYFLDAAGTNSVETIGKILIKVDGLIEKIKPDAFLVLGDTNSCLSAIAAKKKRFQFFTLKQVTVALINVFQKRQIENWWTI